MAFIGCTLLSIIIGGEYLSQARRVVNCMFVSSISKGDSILVERVAFTLLSIIIRKEYLGGVHRVCQLYIYRVLSMRYYLSIACSVYLLYIIILFVVHYYQVLSEESTFVEHVGFSNCTLVSSIIG